MKDYDIKIRNNSEIRVYGTKDNTITVPSEVSIDTDKYQADIDIVKETNANIGLPEQVEHVELNIEDAKLKLEGISFDRCEIDAKGVIEVEITNTQGNIDINMVGGQATLIVPASFSFRTRCEGKGNEIKSDIADDPTSTNVIELNGKNSTLVITTK